MDPPSDPAHENAEQSVNITDMTPPENKQATPNLRERNKQRTRADIRDHAMRLFRTVGVAATNVEQIAAAAGVSESTFFRYFPTKESVVLADDLDEKMIRAIDEQPASSSPLQAIRDATATVRHSLSETDYERERERTRLIFTDPALRPAIGNEFTKTVDLYTTAIARRTDRSTDDPQIRALCGAIVGATLAVSPPPADPYHAALDAMDFLITGLTL